MFDTDKRRGFTLAEVLVTLGLIGAISALTIPTLAFNYKAKVLEEQFRSTYSDIRQIASMINFEHMDVGQRARFLELDEWEQEFSNYLNGGNKLTEDSPANTATALRDFYKEAGGAPGPYRFGLSESGQRQAVDDFVCNGGNIWIDSKGRTWSFKDTDINRFICVDINGPANPNRYNIDIFAFIPMTASMVAAYVYNDADNPNDYTGTIVPCDIERLHNDYNLGDVEPEFKDGSSVVYDASEPSALDACPFFEPVENIPPVDKTTRNGVSARGRTITRQNNYWKDYINYK